MKGHGGLLAQLALVGAFGLFVAASWATGYDPGRQMARTFASTLAAMLGLLPCAFVLIGLFDVWVKRETVERHLGHEAGLIGYLWVLLLAGMTVGGMYLAFPVALSLFRKGARLSVVFAYVGFAGICRIPMVLFEISFLGPAFTAVRLGVSIPLVLITSALLGRFLQRRNYQLTE